MRPHDAPARSRWREGGQESILVSTNARPRASLGVAKKDVLAVLARAHAMYGALLAAVSMFPSPTVTLVAFLALLQALEGAQQALTSTKAKGLASARNLKRNELWTAMESLRAYVQSIADSVTAENAAVLIEAAGLLVAKAGVRHKDILTPVLVAGQPGTVRLYAYATVLAGAAPHKRRNFNWSVSSDGGKTWVGLPSTPYATTEVPNLAMMVEHQFRVSVTIGKTIGEWSQPAKLLVH
jgi:hypothetical protein